MRTLQESNSTCDLKEYSTGFRFFSIFWITLCVALMLSGLVWWRKYRQRLYLKRRGEIFVFFLCFAWVANLVTGAWLRANTREIDAEALCFTSNFTFFLVVPFGVAPQIARLLLFKARVIYSTKLAKIVNEHRGSELLGEKIIALEKQVKSLKKR